MNNKEETKLRPAIGEDYEGVVALIDAAYAEYGERLCLDGADGDLVGFPAQYPGDSFMVLERDGGIVGTVALVAHETSEKSCYLRRLYLDPLLRGSGWARQLMDWAIATARDRGARRMELWSDLRFSRAHAFYQKLGFVHEGVEREMDDSWEPYREYFYYLNL